MYSVSQIDSDLKACDDCGKGKYYVEYDEYDKYLILCTICKARVRIFCNYSIKY